MFRAFYLTVRVEGTMNDEGRIKFLAQANTVRRITIPLDTVSVVVKVLNFRPRFGTTDAAAT